MDFEGLFELTSSFLENKVIEEPGHRTGYDVSSHSNFGKTVNGRALKWQCPQCKKTRNYQPKHLASLSCPGLHESQRQSISPCLETSTPSAVGNSSRARFLRFGPTDILKPGNSLLQLTFACGGHLTVFLASTHQKLIAFSPSSPLSVGTIRKICEDTLWK